MNCSSAHDLITLNGEVANCSRCARLIRHCRETAAIKRRAYLDWDYWGKPVPSFGDPSARLLIVGLAPAAHGANRTGRMFTGDRSGDFLYRSLHQAGFASQPASRSADDGLKLKGAWITAAAHCAPPDNKPSREELIQCRRFLSRELDLLRDLKLVVVLGKVAMDAYLAVRRERGDLGRISGLRFGHNAFYSDPVPALLCSYHPSQQNTSTKRLTQTMLDDVFSRAREFIRS